MNLNKGMRRVALLLGMVGALFGGYRSYSDLQSMLPATLNNHQLRQDANAEPVQQTIRAAKAHDECLQEARNRAQQPDGFIPDQRVTVTGYDAQGNPIQFACATAQSNEPKIDDWKTIQPVAPANPQAKTPQIDPQTGERIPQAKAPPSKKQYLDPVTGEPISNPTPPNDEWEAGITTTHGIFTPSDAKCHAILGQPAAALIDGHPMLVCWDKNYTVVSFEAQKAFPLPYELEPESSAWEYCWCAFLPVLGFFIPWLAVRLVAWALAGFAASPAA
jgi:hypothetical protein